MTANCRIPLRANEGHDYTKGTSATFHLAATWLESHTETACSVSASHLRVKVEGPNKLCAAVGFLFK